MNPEKLIIEEEKTTETTQPEVISSDNNYEILNVSSLESESGHEFRQRYMQLTADLIYHMQGFDSPEEFKPDTVIFLDKSARPVEWMVRELWQDLSEPVEQDGEWTTPEMPKRKFLNIDREQWEHCFEEEMVDPHTSVYYFKRERVKDAEISELRKIFIPDYNPDQDIFEQDALLDNQRLLVVDEVKLTGRTMVAAKNLLGMAFKNVEIDGHHWMSPEIKVNISRGVRANKESPKWYSEENHTMRGVNNRDPENNLFLSTRFDEVDQNSLRLRRDIKQLAEDYRRGAYDILIGKEIIEERLKQRD